MADLTTLDPTLPPDSEVVSNGAARMREERGDLLGWAVVEHMLSGVHAFLFGTSGTRPAAGNIGRIFFNVNQRRIEDDNGSFWEPTHAGLLSTNASGIPLAVSVGSYTDLVVTSVGDVLAGQQVLALGISTIVSGIQQPFNLRITDNGADMLGQPFVCLAPASLANTFIALGALFNQTAGSHVYKLQAEATSGGMSAIARIIAVVHF